MIVTYGYFDHSKTEKTLNAVWQVRNPDAFYTGPIFINYETGETSYPDGVTPPTPEDREILPKFVIVEGYEYDEKLQEKIHKYLEKEYKRRNKHKI